MPKKRDTLSPKIKTAQILLYVDAFIWFCLGTYLVAEMLSFNNGVSAVLVGLFMYMSAAAMWVSGVMLKKRKNWVYFFTLALLFVNILLTFTDQFGIVDLLTFIFDFLIVVFLVSFGGAYLKKS